MWLRQQELLEYLSANQIDYVVLTGDDVAFSSLQYASYFSGHPAFTLLHRQRADAANQLFVYSVDRAALFAKQHSTAIAPADAAALQREFGLGLADVAAALGTPIRITDQERGLSMSEEWAAIAGVDLGMP